MTTTVADDVPEDFLRMMTRRSSHYNRSRCRQFGRSVRTLKLGNKHNSFMETWY